MAIGTLGMLALGSVASTAVGAASANSAADAQVDAANSANATQLEIFNRQVELTEPQRAGGENALSAMLYELGLGPRPEFGGTPLEITEITDTTPGTAQIVNPAYDGPRGYQPQYIPGTAGTETTQYSAGGNLFSTMDAATQYAEANATGGMPYGGIQMDPGMAFRQQEGQRGIDRMAAARGQRFSGNTLRDSMRFNSGLASQEYGSAFNRLASIAGVGQTATGQQLAAGQNYANAFGANTNAAGQARASGYMGVNNALQSGINNGFNIFGMQQAGMLG